MIALVEVRIQHVQGIPEAAPFLRALRSSPDDTTAKEAPDERSARPAFQKLIHLNNGKRANLDVRLCHAPTLYAELNADASTSCCVGDTCSPAQARIETPSGGVLHVKSCA